jgi:hypothetical protein
MDAFHVNDFIEALSQIWEMDIPNQYRPAMCWSVSQRTQVPCFCTISISQDRASLFCYDNKWKVELRDYQVDENGVITFPLGLREKVVVTLHSSITERKIRKLLKWVDVIQSVMQDHQLDGIFEIGTNLTLHDRSNSYKVVCGKQLFWKVERPSSPLSSPSSRKEVWNPSRDLMRVKEYLVALEQARRRLDEAKDAARLQFSHRDSDRESDHRLLEQVACQAEFHRLCKQQDASVTDLLALTSILGVQVRGPQGMLDMDEWCDKIEEKINSI